jgi:hypothetical protein
MVQTPLGPCRLHVREPRAPGDTMGIRWPDRAGIAYPWEEVSSLDDGNAVAEPRPQDEGTQI